MNNQHQRILVADVRDFVDTVIRNGVSDDAVTGYFLRKEFSALSGIEMKLVSIVSQIMDKAGDLRDKDLEPVEADFAGEVFKVLEEFDDELLGDEAFWNYLSVRIFWPFIRARQNSSWSAAEGEPQDPEQPDSEKQKLERYFIGKDHYQIPLRMYLRAKAIRHKDDFSLANVDGTDFWRSQILGVRTSLYPDLARSVVKIQKVRGLSVNEQRPPGRRINRLRSNIDFTNRTEEDNEEIVSELWVITDADAQQLADKKLLKKNPSVSKKSVTKSSSVSKTATSSKSRTKKSSE